MKAVVLSRPIGGRSRPSKLTTLKSTSVADIATLWTLPSGLIVKPLRHHISAISADSLSSHTTALQSALRILTLIDSNAASGMPKESNCVYTSNLCDDAQISRLLVALASTSPHLMPILVESVEFLVGVYTSAMGLNLRRLMQWLALLTLSTSTALPNTICNILNLSCCLPVTWLIAPPPIAQLRLLCSATNATTSPSISDTPAALTSVNGTPTIVSGVEHDADDSAFDFGEEEEITSSTLSSQLSPTVDTPATIPALSLPHWHLLFRLLSHTHTHMLALTTSIQRIFSPLALHISTPTLAPNHTHASSASLIPQAYRTYTTHLHQILSSSVAPPSALSQPDTAAMSAVGSQPDVTSSSSSSSSLSSSASFISTMAAPLSPAMLQRSWPFAPLSQSLACGISAHALRLYTHTPLLATLLSVSGADVAIATEDAVQGVFHAAAEALGCPLLPRGTQVSAEADVDANPYAHRDHGAAHYNHRHSHGVSASASTSVSACASTGAAWVPVRELRVLTKRIRNLIDHFSRNAPPLATIPADFPAVEADASTETATGLASANRTAATSVAGAVAVAKEESVAMAAPTMDDAQEGDFDFGGSDDEGRGVGDDAAGDGGVGKGDTDCGDEHGVPLGNAVPPAVSSGTSSSSSSSSFSSSSSLPPAWTLTPPQAHTAYRGVLDVCLAADIFAAEVLPALASLLQGLHTAVAYRLLQEMDAALDDEDRRNAACAVAAFADAAVASMRVLCHPAALASTATTSTHAEEGTSTAPGLLLPFADGGHLVAALRSSLSPVLEQLLPVVPLLLFSQEVETLRRMYVFAAATGGMEDFTSAMANAVKARATSVTTAAVDNLPVVLTIAGHSMSSSSSMAMAPSVDGDIARILALLSLVALVDETLRAIQASTATVRAVTHALAAGLDHNQQRIANGLALFIDAVIRDKIEPHMVMSVVSAATDGALNERHQDTISPDFESTEKQNNSERVYPDVDDIVVELSDTGIPVLTLAARVTTLYLATDLLQHTQAREAFLDCHRALLSRRVRDLIGERSLWDAEGRYLSAKRLTAWPALLPAPLSTSPAPCDASAASTAASASRSSSSGSISASQAVSSFPGASSGPILYPRPCLGGLTSSRNTPYTVLALEFRAAQLLEVDCGAYEVEALRTLLVDADVSAAMGDLFAAYTATHTVMPVTAARQSTSSTMSDKGAASLPADSTVVTPCLPLVSPLIQSNAACTLELEGPVVQEDLSPLAAVVPPAVASQLALFQEQYLAQYPTRSLHWRPAMFEYRLALHTRNGPVELIVNDTTQRILALFSDLRPRWTATEILTSLCGAAGPFTLSESDVRSALTSLSSPLPVQVLVRHVVAGVDVFEVNEDMPAHVRPHRLPNVCARHAEIRRQGDSMDDDDKSGSAVNVVVPVRLVTMVREAVVENIAEVTEARARLDKERVTVSMECAVVSYLKRTKRADFDEVWNYTRTKSGSDDFALFKQRVEKLISKDYIERDADNPHTLAYVA